MAALKGHSTPTFRRDDTTQSAINYIFASLGLVSNYVDVDVDFPHPEWTDHTLLSLTVKADLRHGSGPDLWRASPVFLGQNGILTQIRLYSDSAVSYWN
ncbi:hypothetical protein CU097_004507 [Rhizopus azygosporus]|uniref:Endonuclease/exonuclease/phosphatase domain-containing protein n=1 Tax=Rhizopus azygosporus TaxID=86630 RepID=A0A367JDT4_RHIAZ|nr:hypothetical protein CU097_004507 [Rhizopus azygosporus]